MAGGRQQLGQDPAPRRASEFRKACARLAQAARDTHRITIDPGWTVAMRNETNVTGAAWRDLQDAAEHLHKVVDVITTILAEQQVPPKDGGTKSDG